MFVRLAGAQRGPGAAGKWTDICEVRNLAMVDLCRSSSAAYRRRATRSGCAGMSVEEGVPIDDVRRKAGPISQARFYAPLTKHTGLLPTETRRRQACATLDVNRSTCQYRSAGRRPRRYQMKSNEAVPTVAFETKIPISVSSEPAVSPLPA